MTIKHHFFDKNCFIDKALANRDELEKQLQQKNFNFSNILFLNQIHSNFVVTIDDKNKIYGNQNLPKADAVVTNLKNLAIAIITADCVPVLLIDEENEVIAAIHAGWRGAKADIIKNTVLEIKKLAKKESKIRAIIGAAIRQKSYEVDNEFLQNFLQEDQNNRKFFIDSVKQNHHMFDLTSYVKHKLNLMQITEIADDEIDTYSSQNLYSYRRSTHKKEQDCGRNISLIVIN